jgi:hypothetical protein
MKNYYFICILFVIKKINCQCDKITDDNILPKIKEDFKVQNDITFNDDLYIEIKDKNEDFKPVFSGFRCLLANNNISLCENFIDSYYKLLTNVPESIKCYEILDNTGTKEIIVFMRLEKDIYLKLDTQNSFELLRKHLKSVSFFVLKAFETKMFPLYGNGDGGEGPLVKEGQENDTWLEKMGYIYDEKENQFYTFSPNINLSMDFKETQYEHSVKPLFLYLKQIFYQGKKCDDMNSEFRLFKNAEFITALNNDKFPRQYNHTILWLFNNVPGDLTRKFKTLLKIYAFAYCLEEIVPDKETVETLDKLLDDDTEPNSICDNMKEKQYFYYYFSTKVEEKKKEIDKTLLEEAGINFIGDELNEQRALSIQEVSNNNITQERKIII